VLTCEGRSIEDTFESDESLSLKRKRDIQNKRVASYASESNETFKGEVLQSIEESFLICFSPSKLEFLYQR
jgi:hypothetical protein